MSASTLLFSCEHGGNRVPPAYAALFADWGDVLASHRGYDPGALDVATTLARTFGAPLVATTVSRLVVDGNRSLGHPALFSERTKALSREKRQAILRAFYQPHREAVIRAVAQGLAAGGRVLHIACHSFTPVFHGRVRRVDVGLLYDPATAEKSFCLCWLRRLAERAPDLRLRRNAPYRGVADGLTTSLRRRFGERYLGVELEMNQRFVTGDPAAFTRLTADLAASLEQARREFG